MTPNLPSFMAPIVAAFLLVCGSASCMAQGFPNKPVRIIVANPGGSSSDIYVRVIASAAEATLGQKIIVEPRPGAGGTIGTRYAISQPADGYTLLQASSTIAVKSAVTNPPFDARKDVEPIGLFFELGLILAVNTSLSVQTARELIELIRANPGKFNMTNYGIGTASHLMGALLMHQHSLNVTSVPFSGSAQNSLALAQGSGDFTFDAMPTLRPHIQAGKVRVLAVSLAERDTSNPDIPTMSESGVSGFQMSTWAGFVAPAGTPPDVIRKLHAALGVAVKSAPVREHFEKSRLPLYPEISSPQKMKAVIERDVIALTKLIRETNLQLD